jgi:hypothetical protein
MPDDIKTLEFGTVIALFDLAERQGIRQFFDDEVGKLMEIHFNWLLLIGQ